MGDRLGFGRYGDPNPYGGIAWEMLKAQAADRAFKREQDAWQRETERRERERQRELMTEAFQLALEQEHLRLEQEKLERKRAARKKREGVKRGFVPTDEELRITRRIRSRNGGRPAVMDALGCTDHHAKVLIRLADELIELDKSS
jgi:hypothetical protein